MSASAASMCSVSTSHPPSGLVARIKIGQGRKPDGLASGAIGHELLPQTPAARRKIQIVCPLGVGAGGLTGLFPFLRIDRTRVDVRRSGDRHAIPPAWRGGRVVNDHSM